MFCFQRIPDRKPESTKYLRVYSQGQHFSGSQIAPEDVWGQRKPERKEKKCILPKAVIALNSGNKRRLSVDYIDLLNYVKISKPKIIYLFFYYHNFFL